MRNKRKIIPIDRLRELVKYDPLTGLFSWLASGKPAFFTACENGYLRGKVDGVSYYAHRAGWALHYGEQPPDDIDHENGRGSENRITNLRAASPLLNALNRKRNRRCKSGTAGVYFNARHAGCKWRASLKIKGRYVLQRYFPTKAMAVVARREAMAAQPLVHRNHGRS